MTTQLLATELANLIQESKRKNNDLRQAAEKSLEDLKSISNVSEQALPGVLSQNVNFVNPFIIACGTKNAKFTAIAIVCLQRLIVSSALPRSRLNQALEALMQASSAGLDVQLKILQALPSLLQNYAPDLKGNLLVTALNICFILQSSKNAIVNNTSAATLQQLVVSVFDKVVAEDKNPGNDGETEAAVGAGMTLRPAALDAYRIFNDVCLLTENQRPEFLRFSGLSQTFGLELIESVITNHSTVFTSHPEQVKVLRTRVMPLIISALKGRPSFATDVRLVRILYTLLRRHIDILTAECADALAILIQLLDQDAALWRRALCMEVFRGLFTEHSLIRRIYSLYDAQKGQEDVLKPLAASFVRLSTEKPAVIGLGAQSSLPLSTTPNMAGGSVDQAMLEASGVTGIISSGVESVHTGISSQFSTIRVPCIDQLDKTDPPSIPESYIYSLVLNCLSSLSDGLAKFILPLTVPSDSRNRRRLTKTGTDRDSPAPQSDTEAQAAKQALERTVSFKKNPVPLNPLQLEDHPQASEISVCASIVDECWPAILATCSTFLYAALDTEHYHGLVRAFQRFAHVAGLLQLSTPRDAFLTTLGKSAVPPNALTACLSAGQTRQPGLTTPTEGTGGILGNARGLISTDNLVPPSPGSEKQRQSSIDASQASLNTRNLLCLRALLNLGIALGPTLGSAWSIVFETLQQADFVLFATGKSGRSLRTQDTQGDSEAAQLMANFGNEVKSVETAASRLVESTVDFPNDAFLQVITAICSLLTPPPVEGADERQLSPNPSLRSPSSQHRRVLSFSQQAGTGSTQEDQFALAKLGDIASINIERLLVHSPEESGWDHMVHRFIELLDSPAVKPPVRARAADTLAALMRETAAASASVPVESRGNIQLRVLNALNSAQQQLRNEGRRDSVSSHTTGIEVHKIILDCLHSIIDTCGEALISGWEITFEIIDSIFSEEEATAEKPRGSAAASTVLTTRSPKLIRSSFASLQLISSDFLATLPNSCFIILVKSLHKFCSQDNDLNIALTTVTFFWALSDFLSSENKSINITAASMEKKDVAVLEKMASNPSHQESDAALWMLLLLRLTSVASDDRVELRNSAIQTLLRIFDAYGDRLNAEAWSICIRSVIFELFSSVTLELQSAAEDETAEADRKAWHETAVVILNGTSSLLANYVDVLSHDAAFDSLWEEYLHHCSTLLAFEVPDIGTATYNALSHVVKQTDQEGKTVFSKASLDAAWQLWSARTPLLNTLTEPPSDNTKCLLSYVAALRQIYALTEDQIDAGRVETILTRLQEVVDGASSDTYSSDVENMTQIQGQVLEAIKMVRTDIEGLPSALANRISKLVRLAFDRTASESTANTKKTFVALSKASTQMLEKILVDHAQDRDLYESGAFTSAMAAFTKPVAEKYRFSTPIKSVQPWRLAITSFISVLENNLQYLDGLQLSESVMQGIWRQLVECTICNLQVTTDALPSGFQDDEDFDIQFFHKIRPLLIPSLGAGFIPDDVRQRYIQGLTDISLIHLLTPGDSVMYKSATLAEASEHWKPRAGRTKTPDVQQRKRMAYVALEELFSLASANNGSSENPALFGKQSVEVMQSKLATCAAPALIIRCALTLRGYASDQPLRGKMPQPLSQRAELVWILRQLVKMDCHKDVLLEARGSGSATKRHLVRLYPLLVRAMGVGTDEKVESLLRETLDVIGGQLYV